MSRIIFSMYINIPKEDIEKQHANCDHTRKNTHVSTSLLLENYDWLVSKQKKYAEICGADYKVFDNVDDFNNFREKYFSDRPYISTYDIINFYKIWLFSTLDYDEVLYFDLDVVPFTNENIFTSFDFESGILCRVNHEGIKYNPLIRVGNVVRSPRAKWFNARELLIDEGKDGENDVYNTGIIGGSRKQIQKLNYFENFDKTLDMMHEMVLSEHDYPDFMHGLFGYDNETLFSYKMIMNEVNLIPMDGDWHYILYRKGPSIITKKAKLVHVVSKDFEYTRENYEKNSI